MPEINYFWDEIEDNVVREYDENNNTLASYTTEPTHFGTVLSQNRSGEKRYFQFDGLGNTTELTDESSDVTDIRRYEAFGVLAQQFGESDFQLKYCGSQGYCTSADSSMCYVRRRHYSPTRHRWLTVDPFIAQCGDVLYSYVTNRPVAHADPSGLHPTWFALAEAYCCPSCHCTSLTINRVGWRLFRHPGQFLGFSPGTALSYIFTASGQMTGDAGCAINATAWGTVTYSIDYGKPKTIYSSFIKSFVMDSHCSLPTLGGETTNSISCRSHWTPCTGTACMLDAPGMFLDGSNLGAPAAKSLFCVELDVQFDVACYGAFGIYGRKSARFLIQEAACVDVRTWKLTEFQTKPGPGWKPVITGTAITVSPTDFCSIK